jgi:hypothetical protein
MTITDKRAERNGSDTEPGPTVPASGNERMPRNVIEAIARVMAELPDIPKDQDMGTPGDRQHYKYRSIEAIEAHASRLMGRYGLIDVPIEIRRKVEPISKGSGNWTRDTIELRYRIYGPGGKDDWIETPAEGQGYYTALADDNSDKGTNKGMTQGRKQLVIELFHIGDNKSDPDSYSEPNTAPRQMTADEWAVANGWRSEDERKGTATLVSSVLAELREGREITRDEAKEYWRQYNHPYPDTPERPGPRTKDGHDEWFARLPMAAGDWADRVLLYASDSQPSQPPEADRTTSDPSAVAAGPEATSQPPEPPVTSADPPAETVTPSGTATRPEPSPADPPASTANVSEGSAPANDATPDTGMRPDNGFRDLFDQRYQEGGMDAVEDTARHMRPDELLEALADRGDPLAAAFDADQGMLAHRLVAIVIRNGRTPDPEKPSATKPVEIQQPMLQTEPDPPKGAATPAASAAGGPPPTRPTTSAPADPQLRRDVEGRLTELRFELPENTVWPDDNGHEGGMDELLAKEGVASVTHKLGTQPQKAIGPQLTKRGARVSTDLKLNRLLLEWIVLNHWWRVNG